MILDSRDTYQTLKRSTGKLGVQHARPRVPGHVDGWSSVQKGGKSAMPCLFVPFPDNFPAGVWGWVGD